MQSFVEKTRKLINENQDLFATLEELDRTGKLRKAKYKGRYTFTIDEDLMNRFKSYCEKNHITMSGIVEELVQRFLAGKNQNLAH